MTGMTPVFFIAEAGVNHNGSLEIALELVDAAAKAGADAVKFQTFKAERLVTRTARKAEYQRRTTGGEDTQFDMLRQLELSEDDHRSLITASREAGITFLSSRFDELSADLLDALDVPVFKLPSGELTNHPLLSHVAGKGRPMILSTGMATLAEVREAVDVIGATGNRQLSLLHCVTEYPAPYDELNLRAMITMRDEFGLPVGFSDHSLGAEASIAAVALGASILEKHFTLDRDLPGPDHTASLEPEELTALIDAVRHVEMALGDGVKGPAPCEVKNIPIARKSLVVGRDLASGDRIEQSDILVKRPGDGIAPRELGTVIGRTVARPLRAGEVLEWKDLVQP
jgi:N,N'-diacetyllegionaminate synthase